MFALSGRIAVYPYLVEITQYFEFFDAAPRGKKTPPVFRWLKPKPELIQVLRRNPPVGMEGALSIAC
jgi:hypothetical protein